MKLKAVLLLLTATFLAITLVNPIYPKEQFLQHAPTVVALIVLAFDCRFQWLTTPAFGSTIAFFWLHILGARYIYSVVPYEQWCFGVFGVTTADLFGFQRNHYDRFVHFAFGWLFLLASSSMIHRHSGCTVIQNAFFSFCVVAAFSGIYEVFEWFLTIVMSPHDADTYNGQQGDTWDVQKDIALAMLGSILAFPFISCVRSETKAS